MLQASTLQLLRFHFSFFLMPVYWLALSQVKHIHPTHAVLVFIILHLIVYPSSNGYNSYMDRDTGPVGGIKDPKQPTRQLFYTSVVMDLVAIAASAIISIPFMLGIVAYIAASRAYSYRGIRLKKYPITGYLTVIIFQGALTFFLVMHGCSLDKMINVPPLGMIAASLLIGGFYPLTQVYQHQQDKADGVTTLSYRLGYKGTFVFTAIIYVMAMVTLAFYLSLNNSLGKFFIIQVFFAPVLLFFAWWFFQVYRDNTKADFKHTMQMNIIASVCTNMAFIYLFISEQF